MKPIEVQIVKPAPKRIELPADMPLESALDTGAALAQSIVDITLAKLKTALKGQRDLDIEQVNAVRAMMQVFEMYEKIEVARRREDKFGDKIAGMTEEQLDAAIAAEEAKRGKQ